MKLKRTLVFFMLFPLLATTFSTLAATKPSLVQPVGPYPRLNKIHFQLAAEAWVETDTAKVKIGVDANLDQSKLDNLQQQVLDSLEKIAKGAGWRVTDYRRQQDQSGLERVHLEAEARLSESAMASIRTSAKKLSSPGLKYTVLSVDFSPSFADRQVTRQVLRTQLMQQAAAELAKINQQFAPQQYQLYRFDIIDPSAPRPMAKRSAADEGMASVALFSAPSSLSVSKKEQLVADVVVAEPITSD